MRWLKVSAAGRRPPLDGPASGCSSNSSAESRTPSRCMTVERESPVTSMTSVRVRARPSRMSRSTPPGEAWSTDICAALYRRERRMSSTSVERLSRRARSSACVTSAKFVTLATPSREGPEEGRSGSSTSARRTTDTAVGRRADPGPRPARHPRPGAAEWHQPRHRAEPLPRHLGVRRARLRPRAARLRQPRPAAPHLSRHARLRARRTGARDRRGRGRAGAQRPRPRGRAASRRGDARPRRRGRLDLSARAPARGRAARSAGCSSASAPSRSSPPTTRRSSSATTSLSSASARSGCCSCRWRAWRARAA